MEIGTLWVLRDPHLNWLWYSLFGTNPVENDLVVVVQLDKARNADEMDLVIYVSLVTGARDFMTKQDFEQAFQGIGEKTNETE